jgi:TPP-dependent pyruvate/acetoin dehydrogenase alpha subunit
MKGNQMDNPDNMSNPDPWHLYEQMLLCRTVEKEVTRLWQDGAIPGEMHLSMGEEAIVVGIVDQLVDGDALAMDHRGTAPMLVRGVNPALLLKEFMGRTDGLCGGKGGHMHLFSPQHLAASSGIVGASGPAALGFALANQRLRPGKISVAFFGEGATNEGMMMESFNLAAVWKLPVMFVCKDNDQSIMTPSSKVTSGNLMERASVFGLRTVEVNGSDVEEVWKLVNPEILRLRNGEGPIFIYAKCTHLEGHLIGDPFLRFAHPSMSQAGQFLSLIKAHTQTKGAPLRERTDSLKEVLGMVWENVRKYRSKEGDPLPPLRNKLIGMDSEKVQEIENKLQLEIDSILQQISVPERQLEGEKL